MRVLLPVASGLPGSCSAGRRSRESSICHHRSIPAARPRRRLAARAAAQPPAVASCGVSKRLAVFVSGGGSNFRAIHQAIEAGQVVVSDKPTCKAVEFAQSLGIPTAIFPQPKGASADGACLTDVELAEMLAKEADYVLLAGYLKLVPESVVQRFPRAMLNIHPGLLPAFGGKGMYGQRVHQAVIDSGARFSGPTVHFVDEEYDHGPILAQACVAVHPLDSAASLAARVLKQEHILYPMAVAALCEGRITWRDDGIPIMWSAH